MSLAKTICEDCEAVFLGGPNAYYCPACRKRRQSQQAKARNLSKLGAAARLQKLKGEKAK